MIYIASEQGDRSSIIRGKSSVSTARWPRLAPLTLADHDDGASMAIVIEDQKEDPKRC